MPISMVIALRIQAIPEGSFGGAETLSNMRSSYTTCLSNASSNVAGLMDTFGIIDRFYIATEQKNYRQKYKKLFFHLIKE